MSLTIHFLEPAPEQRVGGLEAAIRSLEGYLRSQRFTVSSTTTGPLPALPAGRSVLHFHGVWQPAFLPCSARCRELGIPYIVSPHGMLEPWAWRHKRWKKWPWYHLFERRHLAGAVDLLATSDLESQNLRRFFPAKPCRAIPIGISARQASQYTAARRKLHWPDGERILVYLSRVHPKKGLDLLLRAMADVGSRYGTHGWRLVVVGSGEASYVAGLREFAFRNRTKLPSIEWKSEVWGEAKWGYLEGADLMCLPTHSENFGVVVLEALQVGTPVLTTVHTPWQLIRDWHAGWIVEPNESAIARALEDFLASPELTLEQRASISRKANEHFAWDRVGPMYCDLYQSVASSGRKP